MVCRVRIICILVIRVVKTTMKEDVYELTTEYPYVIWGYGFLGTVIYNRLRRTEKYELLGFADNNSEKNNYYVKGSKIKNLEECRELYNETECRVLIASKSWPKIGLQLEEIGIPVEAVFDGNELQKYSPLHFSDIDFSEKVVFYAGDIVDKVNYNDPKMIGISIEKGDSKHILHDITEPFPIDDGMIDGFVAEHVFEHIEYHKLYDVINEIYRILKPDTSLRICLPDYGSKYLIDQVMTDDNGTLIYDANGGGTYNKGIISPGGHMWFPDINNVTNLIYKTDFKDVTYLQYRNEQGKLIKKDYNNVFLHLCREEDVVDEEFVYDMIIDLRKTSNKI